MRTVLASLALLILPVLAVAEPPRKLAVLPLKAGHGVEKGIAEVTTDALVTALQSEGAQVITTRDIEAALGFETEKAKLNVELARRMGDEVCVDNQACLAEIGGALGVAHVVSGSISRVGSSSVLTAQLFDQRRAVVLKRFQESVKSEDDAAFLELAKQGAAALLGTGRTTRASPASELATTVSLPRPPTGSTCDSHWRSYVAASVAVSSEAAAQAAAKREESIAKVRMIQPLLQDAMDRAMLEFALSELHTEELLHRLRLARDSGKADASAMALGAEVLRIDRALLQLPSFSRWTETLFRSSLVHYLLGDLRSADLLCRRLPPGFRPRMPGG